MSAWPTAPLGEVARLERDIVLPEAIEPGTAYVGLEHIESGGKILSAAPVGNGELKSTKFAFTPDHILYGKLRPYLAKIALPDFPGVCTTEIVPIAAGPRMDRRFLAQFLRQPDQIDLATARSAGANLPRLSPAELAKFEVPVPPLAEQRRIAAILDEADALRAKRRAALAQLDEMAPALFLNRFGHPVTNPKRLRSARLGEVATIHSGSTPSKEKSEYWGDGMPWVSPKDMKSHRILDSIDHVTPSALDSGGLKPVATGAILIVVRGMILAHTVPIAIADRTVTINQDMKALRFQSAVTPEFALWCLRVQEAEILEDIATASHGTKRLDTDRLADRPILLPEPEEQAAFARSIAEWDAARANMREQLAASDSLFASLQHRAFRGEL